MFENTQPKKKTLTKINAHVRVKMGPMPSFRIIHLATMTISSDNESE